MLKTFTVWMWLAVTCLAADLGPNAKYNDESPAAIAANDKAILDLQAALPMQGGTLDLRPGVLSISKTIKNPVRWQATGAQEWRPINFAIVGVPCCSKIKLHDPARGDAVHYEPKTPTITDNGQFASNQYVRLGIFDVEIDGGGVKAIGGGKVCQFNNVVISNADIGWQSKFFDAGALGDVLVRRCRIGGRFEACFHLGLPHFNTRECVEDGLIFINCAGVYGQINAEANGGWQISADQLRNSNLHLWTEDQSNRPTRALAKFRRSEQIIITGVDQSNGFDYDPISKATTKILTNIENFPPLGTPLGDYAAFIPFKGKPLLQGSTTTIIAAPGCYQQAGLEDGNVYGELQGFDPTNSIAYKAGDYLSFTCDVVVSQEALDWAGQGVVFTLQPAAGAFRCKRNVRLTGTTTPVEFHGLAPADGAGIRIFAMLAGPNRPQPTKVEFQIKNARCALLRNQ